MTAFNHFEEFHKEYGHCRLPGSPDGDRKRGGVPAAKHSSKRLEQSKASVKDPYVLCVEDRATVWWEDGSKFYAAMVLATEPDSIRIEYGDGDKE